MNDIVYISCLGMIDLFILPRYGRLIVPKIDIFEKK